MEELFSRYHATYTAPTQALLARGIDMSFLLSAPGSKSQWLQRYVREPEHVVRIQMLYPSMGDIWYLRLILRKRPVMSWEDALSWPPTGEHGSRKYVSYQLAAKAAGYLIGEVFDEGKLCFEEALIYKNPKQLRGLLATLTLQGFVTGNIIHDPLCLERLVEDYIEDKRMTPPQAFRTLLNELKKLLATEMKTLEDFGLHIDPVTRAPYQLENVSELQENRELYPIAAQQSLYRTLDLKFPNNDEQQAAFDGIVAAVARAKEEQSQQFVCLHGAGGTGKTLLANKLVAYLRGQGELVAISAATTLAATNYPNAHTVHSLIGYPVLDNDEDNDGDRVVECELHTEKYKDRLEYLEALSLLVIDESFNLDRRVFEALERALVRNKKLVVLCIGDTRQVLPVIEGGTPQDIIGATLTSSHLWHKFTLYFLVENKRLTQLASTITETSTLEEREFANGQALYASTILQLGDGCFSLDDESIVNLMEKVEGPAKVNVIGLPNVAYFPTSEEDEALNWLHPLVETGVDFEGKAIKSRPSLDDDLELKDRAILATKNERVDYWNAKIQRLNPNPATELKSHDSFSDVDDTHGHLGSMLTEEALNLYTNSQVPNHVMYLKVGDICFVMRPLKASGVASNTRVRIRQIKSKVVIAVTLDDNSQVVYIPRMRFKFCLRYTVSFSMTRVAFPLKLCYAMTINKSQGQGFQQALIDFSDDAFTHGHSYVAFSRARMFNMVRVIVREDKIVELPYRDENGDCHRTKRVAAVVSTVYPSVIQRPLTGL